MNIQLSEKILETMSILYVELNDVFRLNVTKALQLKVKNVFDCSSVQSASKLYNENNINIIITDISVHSATDGMELIKSIRKINKKIPIIVISDSKELDNIVKLIKYNLIDYIFKPIEIKQLRDALHRSVEQIIDSGNYITYFKNDIQYNMQKNILSRKNKEVVLTNHERLLLIYFIKNQNHIITKDEIKDIVWENGYDVTDAAFKSLISRLRTKIGKTSIKNSSGNGYILNL